MLHFVPLHPRGLEMVGYLPMIFLPNDPRPAKEQAADRYAHGGGWNPNRKFSLNKEKMTIQYPGDPPLQAVAIASLNDETITVFQHAWVMITQNDGTYEIARMD